MHRTLTTALALSLWLLAPRSEADDSKSSAKPPPFALAGLHAYLFYEPLGETDTRDLFTSSLSLWNTIIGGGERLVKTIDFHCGE